MRKQGYNPKIKQVIQLKKSLYRLKQSSREWQTTLKNLVKKLGYKPLISDSAVFYNPIGIFIVTYVDDCLLIGLNKGAITLLKKELNKVYAIEDRGPAIFFLGVQII